jgi:hypothetical protein
MFEKEIIFEELPAARASSSVARARKLVGGPSYREAKGGALSGNAAQFLHAFVLTPDAAAAESHSSKDEGWARGSAQNHAHP